MYHYLITFLYIAWLNKQHIVRELLSFYKFPGDTIKIVKGSALAAATGGKADIGKDAIMSLMDAVSVIFHHKCINLNVSKSFKAEIMCLPLCKIYCSSYDSYMSGPLIIIERYDLM